LRLDFRVGLLFKGWLVSTHIRSQIGLGGRCTGVRLKLDSCSQQISIGKKKTLRIRIRTIFSHLGPGRKPGGIEGARSHSFSVRQLALA